MTLGSCLVLVSEGVVPSVLESVVESDGVVPVVVLSAGAELVFESVVWVLSDGAVAS